MTFLVIYKSFIQYEIDHSYMFKLVKTERKVPLMLRDNPNFKTTPESDNRIIQKETKPSKFSTFSTCTEKVLAVFFAIFFSILSIYFIITATKHRNRLQQV
jgi:hypothetical protein